MYSLFTAQRKPGREQAWGLVDFSGFCQGENLQWDPRLDSPHHASQERKLEEEGKRASYTVLAGMGQALCAGDETGFQCMVGWGGRTLGGCSVEPASWRFGAGGVLRGNSQSCVNDLPWCSGSSCSLATLNLHTILQIHIRFSLLQRPGLSPIKTLK